MKWRSYRQDRANAKAARRADTEWRSWFAWYPVHMEGYASQDGGERERWVWLEMVHYRPNGYPRYQPDGVF